MIDPLTLITDLGVPLGVVLIAGSDLPPMLVRASTAGPRPRFATRLDIVVSDGGHAGDRRDVRGAAPGDSSPRAESARAKYRGMTSRAHPEPSR